jgi:hypothetical protein
LYFIKDSLTKKNSRMLAIFWDNKYVIKNR